MTDARVLIVGAGPTGLALALWLTRLGVGVRIVDRAADAGTTSRALAVQGRTLELYGQLGIADAVIAGGVEIRALNVWVHGVRRTRAVLRRLGEGLTPYPFVLVHPQDAHERLLIERLAALGVQVERRTALVGVAQQGDVVRATLRRPDGSDETFETPYLAGCDGAGSTVRESLRIGFPGGTYQGRFYVADVDASGPASNDELHVDLGHADFVIVFPLREPGRVRLVGMVSETLASDTLSFDDVRGRAVDDLALRVATVHWFSTYRVHHRVAHRFRDGRVFLLGDAAHIHSPVGGQGMNTGIGDAANLAWKLAAVLRGAAGDALLDSYEPERIAFARRLVATTDRVFTVVTKRGRVARVVRTQIAPRLAPLVFRSRLLRRTLFRILSQIGIQYRHGPLSEGAAGKVHGGDRLPWVETASGEDNFAPLASLDWQLHLYGALRDDVRAGCAALGLPLHAFAWQPRMRRAGLRRGALYLIRPDGYVALADAHADVDRVRRYFAERGISSRR